MHFPCNRTSETIFIPKKNEKTGYEDKSSVIQVLEQVLGNIRIQENQMQRSKRLVDEKVLY